MAQGVKDYFDLINSQHGITLRVHYAQTYEIATNQSTVAITNVQVAQPSNLHALRYLDGYISIDGVTAVSMSSWHGTHSVYIEHADFNDVSGTFGSVSGITHDNEGNKNITITVSIDSFRDSGKADWSVSGSKTFPLVTIPRASSLSVSNGTLGTAQTIRVTRQSTAFSHTITYECGTASGTICTKSTTESISFTPPIDLANQNTTGTSVVVKFTLQTYSGTTAIGSPVVATVAMAIPASIKPGCSLSVSDAMGYLSTFGGYVQGESKLSVTITGTKSYGSDIVSYRATANGDIYTDQSFVTEVLKNAGSQSVTATVTDRRGRTSNTASKSITVLAYTPPSISALSVHRCNADGTENNLGSYAKVTYSFAITSLSNKNGKTITLKYKKSSSSSYASATLTSAYNATNVSYVFAADDGSSYDIILVVADSFHTAQRGTSVSTADVIMHFRADGSGMGLGKVSEKPETLDMGWDIELNGHNLLQDGAIPFAPNGYGLGDTSGKACYDCNEATTIGVYCMMGSSSQNTPDEYYNFRYGVLEVTARWGDIFQTIRYGEYVAVRQGIRDENNITTVASWTPWEYVNPPMESGVTYRTTERWNGQPVYTKLVNGGAISSSGSFSTGISNARIVDAKITMANMWMNWHDATSTTLSLWDFLAWTNLTYVWYKAGSDLAAGGGDIFAKLKFVYY